MKTFGGDPDVIGKSVRVDGAAAVVTGVVPESFRGTLMGVEMDGYVTLDDYGVLSPDVQRWLYHNRKARPIQLFARLKPGVSVAAKRKPRWIVLMASLEAEHPETDRGHRRARHAGAARAAACRCARSRKRFRSCRSSGWRSPGSCCCSRA